MAKIKHITDKHGEVVYPISKEGAIYDDNGVLLSSKIATFITRLVDNLANYYLKSETYTKGEVDSMISAIQGFTCIVVPELPTASAETMGAIYLVPSEDPQTQNIKDEYITIRSGVEGSYTYSWEQIGSTAIDLSGYVTTEGLNEELAKYTTTANLTTLLAGKQDTIADLASIRSGASLGATAYQKPSSGIPASDIAAGVIPDISGKQDVIPDLSTIRSGAAAGATAYQKPSGGIPKTDLASGVQDSLDLADSAVQADPVGSVTPPVTPSDWATAEQVEELEAKVTDLDGVVNGASNPPQDVTPTTQLGYYYWNRSHVLTPDANGGSYYSGTISDNVISGGLDVSSYVGRTLKVTVSGYGATSQRLTAITDENLGILASVQEKDFTADGDNQSTEILIPSGAKYFYWSGIGTLVSVILSAGESRPGLVDEVHANTEKCVNFTIIPSDTQNLINPADVIEGYVYGTTGAYEYTENYWATGKLPVTAGTQYKVLCNSPYAGPDMYRHVCFYGEDGTTVVAGGITTSGTSFTAPANAHFAIVSLYRKPNGTVIQPEEYGLFVGTNPSFVPWYSNKVEVPFVPLANKTDNSVVTKKDLESLTVGAGGLTVVVASPKVTISEGSNSIEITQNYEESREQDAGQSVYDNNPVFDFYAMTYNGVTVSSQIKDDVAPAHILGQTLGANHGQPCRKATITGHGLTNTAIGTAWVQNGVNFYVMRIVDADNIILLSENRGTSTAPSWVNVATGTITKGADTLTISAVSSVQLYPSVKNRQIKLVLDGAEISENGTHKGDVLDIVETYEIMNPASILANIIARAGTSSDPTYTGDAVVRVETVYRFVKGLSVLVISNFVPQGPMSFQDVMFSQAERKGNNGTVKYYVPNSLPFDGNDLRQPTAMTWGNSVSDMFCDQEHSADTTKPINRVIQYDSGFGFAIGFLVDKGVGKNLYDYVTNTFELRGNTGKVYPHGVESSKVGTTLHLGQAYNAVLYRSPFVPSTGNNRLSMYHFSYDGAEYVFLDYKGTMTDRVVIDDSLNGKEISVLESHNVTLLTDVYNGGFYVNTNFVSNETCYLVAKIK